MDACCETMDRFGGPKQYLMHSLQCPRRASLFADWLHHKLPLRSDVFYQLSPHITHVAEASIGGERPTAFHLSAFCFGPECSIKPPPEAETSKRLLEEIMTDGSGTRGEQNFFFILCASLNMSSKDLDYAEVPT